MSNCGPLVVGDTAKGADAGYLRGYCDGVEA